MKREKILLAILILVVIASVVFYREQIMGLFGGAEAPEPAPREEVAIAREFVVAKRYDIPNGSHLVEFTLGVDEEDRIVDVRAVDLEDPGHQKSVDEFSATLLPMIEGVKLSELEPVDKVGKSTLTTGAFNEALADMKAQL